MNMMRSLFSMKPVLLALSFCLIVVTGCAPALPPMSASEALQGERPVVVIYTNEHCKYCVMARNYLDARGIQYEARDIIHNKLYRRQFLALGGDGTPLFLIGNHIVRGFDRERVMQLIEEERESRARRSMKMT